MENNPENASTLLLKLTDALSWYLSCPPRLSVLNRRMWYSTSFVALSHSPCKAHSDSLASCWIAPFYFGVLLTTEHYCTATRPAWRGKEVFCLLSSTTALERCRNLSLDTCFLLCICALEAVFCECRQSRRAETQCKLRTWIFENRTRLLVAFTLTVFGTLQGWGQTQKQIVRWVQ